MGLPVLKYISQEEYLAAERVSIEKHEYFKGKVYTSNKIDTILENLIDDENQKRRHNKITKNSISEISSKLKDKKYSLHSKDFRVNIPKSNLLTYPDLSIFCDEPNLIDDELDTATNPTVIIEILSKSTRNYDQGQKFTFYRAIDSLKEYILIDSEAIQVIQHTKNDNNSWLLKEFNSIEQNFTLKSIDVNLNLVDIYENVKF